MPRSALEMWGFTFTVNSYEVIAGQGERRALMFLDTVLVALQRHCAAPSALDMVDKDAWSAALERAEQFSGDYSLERLYILKDLSKRLDIKGLRYMI